MPNADTPSFILLLKISIYLIQFQFLFWFLFCRVDEVQ